MKDKTEQTNAASCADLEFGASESASYPLPWRVLDPVVTQGANDRWVVAANGHTVCCLFAPVGDHARIMARDTLAYTIAAAPELLKALKRVLRWENTTQWLEPVPADMVEQSRAAIAKAEGRQ